MIMWHVYTLQILDHLHLHSVVILNFLGNLLEKSKLFSYSCSIYEDIGVSCNLYMIKCQTNQSCFKFIIRERQNNNGEGGNK